MPDHGEFRDIVYSDARLYLKMEEWTFGDNRGLSNPAVTTAKSCPDDCGLCNLHTSHTGLANLDLTNRCNLTCPVCFANANAAGYLYEPDFETVRKMLQALRDQKPVAGRIVQFSGGEPTIYPRFLDVLRMAKEMGFSHTQVATNGLKFTDLEFAEQGKEAGLHTLYLQFDGVCDDVYRRTRGESCGKRSCVHRERQEGRPQDRLRSHHRQGPQRSPDRRHHPAGARIHRMLQRHQLPAGGVHRPHRPPRAGIQALHTIRFRPRRAAADRHLPRPYEDWFPLSCVTPFSKLLSALRGDETTTLSCHPHCSLGTYLFVDQNRKAMPVTQFVEVGPMLREMDVLARKAGKRRIQFFTKISAWNNLRKFFHEEKAPDGLTFNKFLQTLQGMTDKKYGRGESEAEGFTYRTLMLAGMHFMDSYNYDVERVKRCVIHYAAPNGLIYPFCAYNSGPVYPRTHREGILRAVRRAGSHAEPDRAGEERLPHLRQRAGVSGVGAGKKWPRAGKATMQLPR